MRLLSKAHDPEFWKSVRERDIYKRYRDELHEYWNKTAESYESAPLPYSKWRLFFESGNRSEYETLYFSRRRVLEHALPLALIYPEDGKYLDKLTDVIFAMMDEYTWCLPAHQGQNDRNDNCRIDLFASETGFYLALVYDLLGDRLEPLIKDRITVEVKRRIFDSFLLRDYKSWWEGGKTNWTAVCTGSVGCAMMLLAPELMTEEMTGRLVASMDAFLSGFAEDGICTEGCGYWAYGVSFFVQFADMLKDFTDGRIDLLKREKVRAIATFPQKMFLSKRAAVSFADGQPALSYTIGTLHRLKDEYPEDVLIYPPELGTFDIGCGRACIRLFGLLWLNEEYWTAPADSNTEFEEYAECAEWLTKRCPSYGFAAKAGHNDEMHNHNDVGSFIFARDGKHILTDIGNGEYTRQYFSSERYTILEPSSRSHSVPIIDGEYQKTGRDAASCDVAYSKGSFRMDIAGAYKYDKLKSLVREFTLTESGVTVKDSFDIDGEAELVERFVSHIEPVEAQTGVIMLDGTVISYDPAVAELSINTESCTAGKRPTVYFIDLKLKHGVREFSVTVE